MSNCPTSCKQPSRLTKLGHPVNMPTSHLQPTRMCSWQRLVEPPRSGLAAATMARSRLRMSPFASASSFSPEQGKWGSRWRANR